jgi:hypothetical protein
MRNPFKRRRKATYVAERERLFASLEYLDPTSDDYHTVMNRIDQLDKILNRTSDLTKTIIPAVGTSMAIGGIYALQQFAGVIVPKALEAHAARQEQKKSHQDD